MEGGHRGFRLAVVLAVGVLAGIGCGPQSGPQGGGGAGGAPPAKPIDAKGGSLDAAVPGPEKSLVADLGNGVTMEFVLVGPGTFMMGTDGGGNEVPRHQVNITRPFYLGKYEVTQEQWQAAMGTNPSKFKGPKNPVEQVRWEDCQGFLARLGEKVPGPAFRLPTEAEWEYACRAGSEGKYGFGGAEVLLPDYAWTSQNSDDKTHPVGQKKSSAWGLYDMHGNVWEWCADWYENGYYAKSPPRDPPGPASGSSRVLRGGSWDDDPDHARAAYRHDVASPLHSSFIGLRCARGLP